MLLSRHQNTGQTHDIKMANRCFENVKHFKYFGTPVTIRIWFRRKLRGDWILVMLATISPEFLSSPLLSKSVKIRIHSAIILAVVLFGCETWSLTLRAEHRLRVFENTVLRRIFGPKRDDVRGSWRKVDNVELRKFCSSPSIIRMMKSRMMRWMGHVARIGAEEERI
jgi:hypothetical protein